MAVNTNKTTNIPNAMATYYDKKLLMNAKPNLVHYAHGQTSILPKNSGKSIDFRKWTPFKALTTPLTEGVAPDGQTLDMTHVTADISQYGGYVAVSDLLDLTAIDPVVNDSVELMGDQGGLTVDTIVRDVISNSTNVQFPNGKLNANQVTSTDKLTVDEIRKAVRTLKSNKAPMFNRGRKGYYIAIVGPDTVYDLQSDKAWIAASQYAGSEQVFNGEIGRMYGVVFIESTQAKLFPGAGSSGINLASTIIFGKNAYGVVDLEGRNLRSIIKPKGSAGTSDPLDQISTIGWKVEGFAAKVLQPLWIIRIEHAVSA